MAIEKEIVDRLLANYEKPEDLTGENGVLRQLTKALMERALEAEMATHLGYERHDQEAKPNGNRRNGKSKKTLKGDFGEIEIATPRDREATFEPRIIAKGQTRMAGLDAKILSMYARGMTTRADERRQEVAHYTGLAAGSESLRDSLGRPLPRACEVTTMRTSVYTILLTLPKRPSQQVLP